MTPAMKTALEQMIQGRFGKTHWRTHKALLDGGYITEDGAVTELGQEASGIEFQEVAFLVLGSDVQIGKHVFPKGQDFVLTWADKEHKDRRKWSYTVVFRTSDKRVVSLTIWYSPKHIIEIRKLPIDTESEMV